MVIPPSSVAYQPCDGFPLLNLSLSHNFRQLRDFTIQIYDGVFNKWTKSMMESINVVVNDNHDVSVSCVDEDDSPLSTNVMTDVSWQSRQH